MPPNDDTHESSDRLDPFLLSGPTLDAPRSIIGLEDFLAVPPIPAEPTAPKAGPDVQSPSAANALDDTADFPVAAPSHTFPETIAPAVPSILASFPTPTVDASAVAQILGDVGPSLIAPPDVVFPGDASTETSIVARLTAGVEQGGEGDVLSALAANSLGDGLIADPSSLLSAFPLADSTNEGNARARLGSWSADSSWSGLAGPLERFDAGSLDAGPVSPRSPDAWSRGDDRTSSGSEAFERIEGRLSQVVAKLEEAVDRLSAPGPSPLGSRPRGFRGRIDA
jgi:hypothetical protein